MAGLVDVIQFLIPFLLLGLIVYVVVLLSRLARATEQIAAVLSSRMPRTPGQ